MQWKGQLIPSLRLRDFLLLVAATGASVVLQLKDFKPIGTDIY